MAKSRKSLADQVPTEIFWSIFNKLSFIDLIQAKAVCSSWNLAAEEFVSKMPWLMLPSKKEVEEGDGAFVNNNGYNGFFNLCENRVYNLKTTPMEFRESCCIGSSNGWLVFLEHKAVPFLFNPFKQIKIHLPSVDYLLGLKKMERNEDGEYEFDYLKKNQRFFFKVCGKEQVRECFIQKAILSGKPDCNENFGVVLLCNNREEIAYHQRGYNSWTVIDVSHPPYRDIICHKNHLYALTGNNSIEVWDLGGRDYVGRIVNKSDIVLPFPDKSHTKGNSLRGFGTSKFYLVESCDDLLLIVRFTGDYVDFDGTLLTEWDLLTETCTQPKICPYRTCFFHVYQLDFDELKWVEVESLNDRALFLGGNQSVSVSVQSFPHCETNSIYFTDDCWEKMEEDYNYGGHDMGIYNIKDESFKPIYEFSSDKIQPPPCWIIPSAMLESQLGQCVASLPGCN
ncbi:hypothetical protein Gohar_005868 [Gossypium harknessii]|uniref:F-box domain-containing protein n=1 Tax=Gossypium harknessii TaxID=34285 RepID=A0A7J9HAJ3_9ROSI|nr:hypothetical protein [Gossypium harknessii]